MNDEIKLKYKNNKPMFINKLSKYKVKCECGHVLILVRKPYGICSWCGKKVYRSKKDEFEDKLSKSIKTHC